MIRYFMQDGLGYSFLQDGRKYAGQFIFYEAGRSSKVPMAPGT